MFQNYIQNLDSDAARRLIVTLIILLVAVLLRIAAALVINSFIGKVSVSTKAAAALKKRAQTLASLTANIANVGILGVALVMIIAEWGVNITPIITGLGVVGLAISFGTQTLIRDIVSGFFILFENVYNVGDRVKIAGVEGSVKEINLRTTILEGEDGKTFVIPNSAIQTVEKGEENKSKTKK
jgi:small-conductance mechanosensitive channel